MPRSTNFSNEDIDIIITTEFFKNLNTNNSRKIVTKLAPQKIIYDKDEIILREGEDINSFFIIAKGEIHIVRYDLYGRKHIISSGIEGDIFAESFAFSSSKKSKVDVIAIKETQLIAIDYENLKLINDNEFLFEIIRVLSDKNIFLQQKLQILSRQKMRDKVLLLLQMFRKKDSIYIKIPFNREQMSEFLCVDRSSLSRELNKMKKDGLIDFEKNIFKIVK